MSHATKKVKPKNAVRKIIYGIHTNRNINSYNSMMEGYH